MAPSCWAVSNIGEVMIELERIGQRLSDLIFVDTRYDHTYQNEWITDYLRLTTLDDKHPTAKACCIGRRCEFDREARHLLWMHLAKAETEGMK